VDAVVVAAAPRLHPALARVVLEGALHGGAA
jgi:hypothetical protein